MSRKTAISATASEYRVLYWESVNIFQICEVFIDTNLNPCSYRYAPGLASGSYLGIRDAVKRMAEALQKPVLYGDGRFPEWCVDEKIIGRIFEL